MLRESQDYLARALSRVTSSGEFIPEVDGLRFIAIAGVVLHHMMAGYLITTERLGQVQLPRDWWQVFPRSGMIALGYAGHFGVPLFFVISGFVLSLPFARYRRGLGAAPNLKSYYLRRLIRLEPPYIISLTIAFLVIRLTNPGWPQFVSHYVASLLYLHGIVFGGASWVNSVAWSLEIEVQFYIIMPVLGYLFTVRNTRLRRLILLVLVLVTSVVPQQFIAQVAAPGLQLSVLNFLQYFLAGFLLADLYLTRPTLRRQSLAWDLVVGASALVIFTILTRYYFFGALLPLAIMALYMGCYLGRVSNLLVTRRWIVIIGGMCYTIYLYHNLILQLIVPRTMTLASSALPVRFDFLLQVLLLSPPILVISSVLFVCAEKPFMRLSRRVRFKVEPSRAPLNLQAAPDVAEA